MTGVEAFNSMFDGFSAKRMKGDNQNCLNDFYNYISMSHESSTSYLYLSYVANFLESENITDVSEIKLRDYTSYFVKLKNKTASYQKTMHSALKKFSKYLKISGICAEDYMENIERPKKKDSAETIAKRESDYMSPKELKAYMTKVEESNKRDIWKQRDVTIIKTLMTCGIRRSALQKLDTSDIDLENQIMTVTEKGAKVREIYLSDDLVEEIKKWLEFRSTLHTSDPALFLSNRKQRLHVMTINQIVKRYDEEAHPHEFRSSYATTLYSKSKDVYFVQQCMGHASPAMTERYIRGQKSDATRKASEIMGKII